MKFLINIILILIPFVHINASSFGKARGYVLNYIERVAKSMVGKRYKWGGDGPFAYDCSGFTREVFEENGIVLPRRAKEQARVGTLIRRRFRKGDLLFFSSKEGSKKITHVGIYLGNGKFIHASRFHKRVVISPFREYKKYFIFARRVV